MKSQGTILRFKLAGEGSFTAIGKLKSIGAINVNVDEVDVTTLDSEGGYKEFEPGFKDSGEFTVSGLHKKGEVGQKKARDAFNEGKAGEFELVYPDKTKYSFSGFFKGYELGAAEVDGSVNFGATIRISGPITEGTEG